MRFYDDLDKAIERLSASKHANPECQADRRQMCEWLKELKQLREAKAVRELMFQSLIPKPMDKELMIEWLKNR